MFVEKLFPHAAAPLGPTDALLAAESNKAEIPNPSISARGVRQAMHSENRSTGSGDAMNSASRASQSISRSKNRRTAALDSSDSRALKWSRHRSHTAYSSTHSSRT